MSISYSIPEHLRERIPTSDETRFPPEEAASCSQRHQGRFRAAAGSQCRHPSRDGARHADRSGEWFAKFPSCSRDDGYDVVGLEATSMTRPARGTRRRGVAIADHRRSISCRTSAVEASTRYRSSTALAAPPAQNSSRWAGSGAWPAPSASSGTSLQPPENSPRRPAPSRFDIRVACGR